jgi:hypothetical protein
MQYKKLKEFNVDDVVTKDGGEVFEIKAINKTGSVKVFVKECVTEDEYVAVYEDVYGNIVRKGKVYTVNIENPVWRLLSNNNSLEQEILSYESQVKVLLDKISKAKEVLEKQKYPEINVGEMYVFTKLSGSEFVGIVVAIDDDDPELTFTTVDSYFDVNDYTLDYFQKIVQVNTMNEKKMADYVTKFYNEEYKV